MVTGTVVFFHSDGGYGFIDPDDSDEDDDDVFIHMADVDGPDLEEGERLSFTVEDAEQGPRARDIERLDDEDADADADADLAEADD